jgi:tetraprenyl-beta-curcumene synthase
VISALATYRGKVLPAARGELRSWATRAARVPDPELRRAALSSLTEKAANAEATAVFAILAPRPQRLRALRAMTALQTAVDYLDTLGERPVDDPLAAGLALHRALGDAVAPALAPAVDWYAAYPHREDGGYLAALVATCQRELAALPAVAMVRASARGAAQRCGEGQAHTHAAAAGDDRALRAWAESQPCAPGYAWWEIAAGASSSVAVHALIAAAADPRTGPVEAELVDAAYSPAIGALTVLLDDLVDREHDLARGEHNYLAHCPSGDAAADRLAFLAARAKAALAPLRRRRRHAAILAGVAGFYLSEPAARSGYAAPARARLLAEFGGGARLIAATRWLWGDG